MAEKRRRVAVLISGRGSNLQALARYCAQPQARAEIGLVLSDRADAQGLAWACSAGLAADVISTSPGMPRAEFELILNQRLQAAEIELICLAGFMRILSAGLVGRWRDRVLNIHPSLLPAFRGLDTHARALQAGVRFHGCTVHFVRAEVDAGPIIVQGVLPVQPQDDPTTLAARVLAIEHQCYPWALDLVASGRAQVAGEQVVIDAAGAPDGAMISPLPEP